MEWTEVRSSNIKLVGVDGRDLLITFHHGEAVYRYPGAGGHFQGMIGAESVGKYFNSKIRAEFAGERTG